MNNISPLNDQLNPICHLLALLGAHHILHVSRIRVKRSILIYIVLYSAVFLSTVIQLPPPVDFVQLFYNWLLHLLFIFIKIDIKCLIL